MTGRHPHAAAHHRSIYAASDRQRRDQSRAYVSGRVYASLRALIAYVRIGRPLGPGVYEIPPAARLRALEAADEGEQLLAQEHA